MPQELFKEAVNDLFDEVAREDTQGLIIKDLLLEQDEKIKIVCENDKSHTTKLTEGS